MRFKIKHIFAITTLIACLFGGVFALQRAHRPNPDSGGVVIAAQLLKLAWKPHKYEEGLHGLYSTPLVLQKNEAGNFDRRIQQELFVIQHDDYLGNRLIDAKFSISLKHSDDWSSYKLVPKLEGVGHGRLKFNCITEISLENQIIQVKLTRTNETTNTSESVLLSFKYAEESLVYIASDQ